MNKQKVIIIQAKVTTKTMYAKTEDDCNTINAEEAQETFDPIEPLTEADLQANGTVY